MATTARLAIIPFIAWISFGEQSAMVKMTGLILVVVLGIAEYGAERLEKVPGGVTRERLASQSKIQ